MRPQNKANTYRLYPTPDQAQQMAQTAGACRSGIYCITHESSGRVYVGSATYLKQRLSTHRSHLRRGRHHSKKLQNAWVKHGEAAFVFSVLEYVTDKNALVDREQAWIDNLRAFGPLGFNMLPTAGSPLGRKHAAETKAKQSVAHLGRKHTDEHRANNAAARIGKPISRDAALQGAAKRTGLRRAETAIAKAAASNRGKTRSVEAKLRMSAWQIGRSATPEQLDILNWTGRKHSAETIEKMRLIALAREAKKRAGSSSKPVEGHLSKRPDEAGSTRRAA